MFTYMHFQSHLPRLLECRLHHESALAALAYKFIDPEATNLLLSSYALDYSLHVFDIKFLGRGETTLN